MIHHQFPESAQITDEEHTDSILSQGVALIMFGMALGIIMGAAGMWLALTEVVL